MTAAIGTEPETVEAMKSALLRSRTGAPHLVRVAFTASVRVSVTLQTCTEEKNTYSGPP